jgi:L-erythrulose 1-phosphate isomerase
MFIFGTNTKMQHSPQGSQQFLQDVIERARAHLTDIQLSSVQLFYIPPYTSLTGVSEMCQAHNIWLGAQNTHWELGGAFTGEVPAPILKASGATFVMLGHVERRQLFGETDETINKKILAASSVGLRIMLCVGESSFEKRAGAGKTAVTRQLELALADFKSPDQLLILYEPVWSIGTGGEAAHPDYVAIAMDDIRSTLQERFGQSGESIPILYGGSVNAENCADYAVLPQCAGLGVGRAGWEAESFVKVLQTALTAR